ncbi:LlaJI family restriction endonuclease [Mycoplasmopsis agassizii]|uniref:LlaJI family restriction endonuclease n=1 Tax=Mycoplasmopsis agassizii TaxID=33922 RepID=A0ABX4H5A9_9BACT|nr:LlaJI family restriction endonuclease [Mycoplasmopsis agassizii]PAF55087.1 LlaJI family restriction endonuclease [Mycoplasmopsis agassizii]SMC19156.1 LlaJI restriction endonuclease [Mycoplasmopsis agassizii]
MKTLVEACRNFSGTKDDQFIGVKFEQNDLEIVFPYGYRIPRTEKDCKESIRSLISTFSLSQEMFVNNKTILTNNKNQEVIPFSDFFWLISDYLNNGSYMSRTTSERINTKGKINWKKTLNSTTMFFGKKLFFQKIFVNKNNYYKSQLTDIHMHCLNISLSFVGFLYPGVYANKSSININRSNLAYYISLINKEINLTFIDRNLLLLNALKRILLSYYEKLDAKASTIKYGVSSYETIWESLIKYHFSNQNESNFYPSASWYILNREKYNDSHLRPDTIMKLNNSLYILDAKYYKFGVSDDLKDLPHTDSIQKQITYGDYAYKMDHETSEIFNAFLMPFDKENNSFHLKVDDISVIGYAKSNWNLDKEELNNKELKHRTIFAILLDTKFIIDSFWKRNQNIKKLLVKKVKKAYELYSSKSYL